MLIPPSNLDFLKLLKKNNNREWFAKNKERYLSELSFVENFAQELLELMNKHDVMDTESGKKSLFRIYKDTRFSKDKTPYKNQFSGRFVRKDKHRRGGYYFHIEPGNSFLAGGFWGPEPADLKRIREEFAFDAAPFRKILKSKSLIKTFGGLEGEQIKTTPKGFLADDEAIDLMRYKQFILMRRFSDKEVLDKNFVKVVNDSFKQMRPFLDYFSEVLTTDVNGVSLLEK